MKYFKPELLARCRSLHDDVADAAAQQWGRAIDAYRQRLQAIRPQLPRAVRGIIARASLHDAKVLTITSFNSKRQPRFNIQIKLEDTPLRPGEVLELSYLVVPGPQGGLRFTKPARLSNDHAGPEWILYDEFDLDEKRDCFTHSLLLTGFEIEVRFHNMRVRRMGELFLPSVVEIPEGKRTWPLVGA